MFHVNICLFENIPHIVFIEIVPFYRYRAVCLRIVVYIMIGTVPFEFIAGSSEFFNCLLPWIHYVPPFIILYTKLCTKAREIYTKIHKIVR